MSTFGKRLVGFLLARPLIAILIAAAVVGVLLLTQTRRQKTPVTHRQERVALTDAQQMQLGSEEYAKTLRQYRARIVQSGSGYSEVQRVARRIEAVAGRDKPAFVWKVTLLRRNEANAYCLPGGKIVVYTGILPLTRNDAGLATVLGHEVAHATAEHVAERIERQHLTEVAAAIIAGGVAVTPGQYIRIRALLGVGGAASSLPFSRAQESEADHIGLVYMARADTTHARRSLSGSACCGRRGAKSRPSSRATTQATNTGWSGSRDGCPRRSWRTSRLREVDAAQPDIHRKPGLSPARTGICACHSASAEMAPSDDTPQRS
jgi:Zn-dependent protease with chaperone function